MIRFRGEFVEALIGWQGKESKMDEEAGTVDEMKIDELLGRYKDLRLTYFPHWKVTPWDKREKEATVDGFLSDLELYLLERNWSIRWISKGLSLVSLGFPV